MYQTNKGQVYLKKQIYSLFQNFNDKYLTPVNMYQHNKKLKLDFFHSSVNMSRKFVKKMSILNFKKELKPAVEPNCNIPCAKW